MGKTTIEQSKNKYIVVNKLTYPEAINERELNAIAAGMLEHLIPVHAEKSKKGAIIKSSIVGMMSLQSYFSGIVSKKMFLDVISQMIAVVKECEKNLMNVNNLMLDFEYIFLDPVTKKIKCIFWPIVNNSNSYILAEFFKEIPFRVVFSKHENHDYVGTYLRYFKNHTPFSINGFEKIIFELMGKTVENKTHLPSGSTGFGDIDRQSAKLEEVKGSTGNIAYNPLSQNHQVQEPISLEKSNICSRCGNKCSESARFCGECGSPLNDVEPITSGMTEAPVKSGTENFSETIVLGQEDYGGGTTVLGADVYEEPVFPYLIREKTQEKISVNKTSFRIGKERQYCDYFVSNNNAVSRSHADIITKETRYYIIDNNSTNKTYVDGRVIPVQKEIEIFPGTKIRLGNEEFVFYM